MFNLEQAISGWREEMLAAGIRGPVPLDELETHLREEIELQVKSGMNEGQAFKNAAEQIGQAHALRNEFKKVEEAKTTSEQKLTKLFAVVSLVMSLGMGWMVLFKIGNFAELTSGQQISSLAAVGTFSLLAWGGRLGYRMFPVIRAKRIRNRMTSLAFGLLAVWWCGVFYIILPRYDFDIGQLLVAFHWLYLTPAGALGGLIWGIATAAGKAPALARP